jgi:hypothetical protein
MKKKTHEVLFEACDLVNSVDQVLAHVMRECEIDAKDCYNLAEKLERACHMLLVVGDRKTQEDLNKVALPEGVPF